MPNEQGRNVLHFLALSGGITLVQDLITFFNQTYINDLETLKMVDILLILFHSDSSYSSLSRCCRDLFQLIFVDINQYIMQF